MYKIANDFFQAQEVKLPKTIAFEQTDLYVYLRMMSGSAPVKADQGIIKIIERDDHFLLVEHIYYDYYPEIVGKFYTIPGINLRSIHIQNTQVGKNLSKKGYHVFARSDRDYLDVIDLMPKINFNLTPDYQGLGEPYATFKFNPTIWQKPLPEKMTGVAAQFYHGLKGILESMIDFSDVLASLDTFDLNVLEWQHGRNMDAHNGIDYRSFVNLITYNTDHCSKSRTISVGEFNWYESTFQALATNDYEALMAISDGKKLSEAIMVDTKKAVLVSVFNPKFYHEVGQMTGEGSLYVCTSNKSFKAITDRFDFRW